MLLMGGPGSEFLIAGIALQFDFFLKLPGIDGLSFFLEELILGDRRKADEMSLDVVTMEFGFVMDPHGFIVGKVDLAV